MLSHVFVKMEVLATLLLEIVPVCLASLAFIALTDVRLVCGGVIATRSATVHLGSLVTSVGEPACVDPDTLDLSAVNHALISTPAACVATSAIVIDSTLSDATQSMEPADASQALKEIGVRMSAELGCTESSADTFASAWMPPCATRSMENAAESVQPATQERPAKDLVTLDPMASTASSHADAEAMTVTASQENASVKRARLGQAAWKIALTVRGALLAVTTAPALRTKSATSQRESVSAPSDTLEKTAVILARLVATA